MAALDALENAQRVEVLITRVRFPPGKPNGIALALMARHKRPGIKVLFTARPEFATAKVLASSCRCQSARRSLWQPLPVCCIPTADPDQPVPVPSNPQAEGCSPGGF